MPRLDGLVPALGLAIAGPACAQPGPVINNSSVTVRDLTLTGTPIALDYTGSHITVYLSGGDVRGQAPARAASTPRVVTIDFKDGAAGKYPNRTGYPTAFQRPGIRKLAQTARYTVWSYTWQPGKPTPMHFHDTDVIVIYRGEGMLDSVTPDGKHTLTTHHAGEIRFNKGDRAHYELLTKGDLGAVMVELH